MDIALTIIGILGTLASVIGALFAWRQATRSRSSARAAEDAYNAFASHIDTVERSRLYERTNSILRTIKVIGPACSEKSIRGVKCQKIAEELHNYTIFLRERLSNFNEDEHDTALELCTALEDQVPILAQAKSFSSTKTAGTKIHNLIISFLPTVKVKTTQNTKGSENE